MEIKIVITKQNKEQVIKLIDQLVECEAEAIAAESTRARTFQPIEAPLSPSSLMEPLAVGSIKVAEAEVSERKFGTWGMFNSFIPGKAGLRVLANLISKKDVKSIRFSDLMDECIRYFSRSGLCKYRGFPKKTSESARTRLATHLMRPYHDIGLMRIYGNNKDPQTMITNEGLDFARLPNLLLDGSGKKSLLSEEESKWMINYLKMIDRLGYKEFSILKDLTGFLAKGEKKFGDIVNWFKDNQDFVNWLRNGSRYKDDPDAFSRQLQNVARTFASGKIALLRELGVLSMARANYEVLRSLEV